MSINKSIFDFIKNNNNIITTSQLCSLGFSRQVLTNYIKQGLLVRCRQGVYILPNEIHDDMYTMMLRSKKIVFSHETALFLNGQSQRTPFKYTITMPSNSSLPSSLKSECNCFYVKPELYTIGIVEKKNLFGNIVRFYNLERTICDLIRNRNKVSDEIVVDAIKKYAFSQNKNLNLLYKYARLFKVEEDLRKYLEVLL